jgi:hypothetical protein
MEFPAIIEESSHLFLHLSGDCLLILDDVLGQFDQYLIALNETLVLPVQVALDGLDLPDEKGRVLDVISLALLYDLPQCFRRLLLVLVQFLK